MRAQLAAERRHATQVAAACVAALEESATVMETLELTSFAENCLEYLLWLLGRFQARHQMLLELGQTHHEAHHDGEQRRRQLQEMLERCVVSREALTRLVSPLEEADPPPGDPPQGSWRELAQIFDGDWSLRCAAADELFIAEGDALSSLNASSVLEERSRFARVQAAAPPGFDLRTGTGHG